MDVSTSILFGLLAMTCWGLVDILAKYITGDVGWRKALFFNQLFGLIILLVFWKVSGWPLPSLRGCVELLILNAMTGLFGWSGFYASLSLAPISSVLPIICMFPIVSIPLSIFFLNEHPTLYQLIGGSFALCCLATLEMTRAEKRLPAKAIALALASMFFIGVTSFLNGVLAKEIGWFGVTFYYRGALFILTSILFLTTRTNLTPPKRPMLYKMCCMGLLEILGLFAFNYGSEFGLVSIVSLVSSFSPAVAIILAVIFLHETLNRREALAIAGILTGIVLIGLPGV